MTEETLQNLILQRLGEIAKKLDDMGRDVSTLTQAGKDWERRINRVETCQDDQEQVVNALKETVGQHSQTLSLMKWLFLAVVGSLITQVGPIVWRLLTGAAQP